MGSNRTGELAKTAGPAGGLTQGRGSQKQKKKILGIGPTTTPDYRLTVV